MRQLSFHAFSPAPPEESKLRSSLAATIDRKRMLYMKILKEEFLRELNYLWEVAGGRAKARDTLTQKVVEALMPAASIVPWAGQVVKALSVTATFAANQLRDRRIGVVASLKAELDIARLNILLEVVVREALRRYESFIVDRLSDDPEKGVVPFAKVGARRMVEYLSHHGIVDAQSGVRLTLSESVLLAGLTEGQSGAGIEGFLNQPLELKKTKTNFFGRNIVKTIDAEDVYARAGLRHFEIQDGKLVDTLYIRSQPKHHESSEWRRFHDLTNGKMRFGDFGYVRFSEEDKSFSKDPKAGYVVMPLTVIRDRYDFELQERKGLSPTLQAEVRASFHGYIQVDRATIAQYIVWAQSAADPSLVAYVRHVMNYPQVQKVFCTDDLSGLALTGLNFSHCDFSGAILSGDLTGVNLSHSDLIGTVFGQVTSARKLLLVASSCQYLSAEGVDFRESNLTQANFDYAHLKGANLIGCQLLGTQWAYADLIDIRADVDLLSGQREQIVELQEAVTKQRQELQALTEQLSKLQAVSATLVTELEKPAHPQFKELSAEVQSLLQRQEARFIFEAQCQKEISQLETLLARKADKSAIRLYKEELIATQNQLKQLQADAVLKTDLQAFQVRCEQQFQTLSLSLQSSLTDLQRQMHQDFQQALQLQDKRLTHLMKQISDQLTELEGRVDVLEKWIKNAEDTLAHQQTGQAETKQSIHELQSAIRSLRKDLQEESQKRAQQEKEIANIQEKITAASTAKDIKQARQLQTEIQRMQVAWSQEESSEQPPVQLLQALEKKQLDFQKQLAVLEKGAFNAAMRQKLQSKFSELQVQQKQWTELIEKFHAKWSVHHYVQTVSLEKLQAVYETCEQRIRQLEGDVEKLKIWAEETRVRLAGMENEENEVKKQLGTLQAEMSQWIAQQAKYQSQLDAFRQGRAGEATLLELQNELKDSTQSKQMISQIETIKALYNEQKAALLAVIEQHADLRDSLQNEQAAIGEKVKALEGIERDFHEKQSAALQNLREEMQAALQKLEKQVVELDSKVVQVSHRLDTADPRYTLAIRLKTLRQKVLEDKDIMKELDYYIAPNGQSQLGGELSDPLFAWVEKEFLNTDCRVLLLQGLAGSGKSTFNRHLQRELWNNPVWEEFKPGSAPPKALVPLFAPLGSTLVDGAHLFDYLRDTPELVGHFTEVEINVLKSDYQLLWIADGYDEIPGYPQSNILNIYDKNFSQYSDRIKLLVSCRPLPPREVDESTYFVPHQADGKLERGKYRTRYVAPFTPEQRLLYVERYLKKQKENKDPIGQLWADAAAYEREFTQIPQFERLINTPLLLRIAVEVLPEIIEAVRIRVPSSDSKSSLSSLDEARAGLTQKMLFDHFVAGWFNREAQKAWVSKNFLTDPEELWGSDWYNEVKKRSASQEMDPQICFLKASYMKFCQEFALHLSEEGRVSFQYPPEVKKSSPFDKNKKVVPPVPAAPEWAKVLLGFDENGDILRTRRGCPILKSPNNEFGFYHPLLIAYFETSVITPEIDRRPASPVLFKEKSPEKGKEGMNKSAVTGLTSS